MTRNKKTQFAKYIDEVARQEAADNDTESYTPDITFRQSQSSLKGVDQEIIYFNPRFLLTFHSLLLLVSFIAGFFIVSHLERPHAQTTTLFSGSQVSNWQGKQLGSGCGSSVRDVNDVPPGKTGTSIEIFVKDGCVWSGDAGANPRERTELNTAQGQLTFVEGTIWYIDFWQRFDQLANTHSGSDWDMWLQTHFTGGGSQPNLILTTDGSNRMIFKTSTGGGHSGQWTGPVIQTGVWQRFTLGVKFSISSAAGWVELYKDGQPVLPRKAVATLGTDYPQTGYLKKGIYRNGSISGDEKYTMYGLAVHSVNPLGASPPPPPPPSIPSAPVVSISASTTSLQQGSAATLTWSATNAPTSCIASGDWSGAKTASGSQSTGILSTVKTYSYTLACTNAGGTGSATASVAVSATPPPPPAKPTITLSANPSTINAGGSSTISWSATNAPTSCTASGDWSGTKTASGSQSTGTLSTVKTYTYTLSCSNSGGTTTGSVALVVVPVKPTVTISLSPGTINSGGTSTISWSATNAPTSCTASGDWTGSKAASGSQSTGTVSAGNSKTYTLTCTNTGGSASASTTLSVSTPANPINPNVSKPTVTLTATPSTVETNQKSTISWSATNAPTSCTASGDWTGTKPSSGTENTKQLTNAATYTLTCTNAGGSTSASTSVSIVNITQTGEVTVNNTPVPNLKVDNPSIVGEHTGSSVNEGSSGNNASKTEAGAKPAVSKLTLTKPKLIAAGVFSGLITMTIATWFGVRFFIHRSNIGNFGE